ncbi:MAG: zinc ribbon domain-containing protein [Anaerolineae bacterium]|nr:zinc ribbon domain-containing protein [Anaerolineae bacterium]
MTDQDNQVYEMLWDCRSCGTKKLLAKSQRFCPSCGSPQDAEWRYFPSDADKVAVKNHQYVGADKICPACGTLNAAAAEFCPRCGAPQANAEAVGSVGSRIAKQGEQLIEEDLYARQDAVAAARANAVAMPQNLQQINQAPEQEQQRTGVPRWVMIMGALALVVIGAVIFIATSTRESQVIVSGFEWEREIKIEELRAVSESRVCTSMPNDAYSITRNYEQVGTERVQDGETCRRQQVDQGDGTFREQQVCEPRYREEPVYDYVCYYSVDRWQFDRSAITQGDKNVEPYWERLNLRDGSCRGCEREASREERYLLILQGDENKVYECPVTRDLWETTRVESAFTLAIGTVLGDARCDTLKSVG